MTQTEVTHENRTGQQRLWDSWVATNPQTPEEIDAFYRGTEDYEADLNEWHSDAGRQTWTQALVHIAKNVIDAKRVLDIGCGAGHDMRALRAALPDAVICGVEVNERARAAHARAGFTMYASIDDVPDMDSYDLVSCFDVLEHIVDPETFVTRIARAMRLGAVFIETTATDDIGTPLHLEANWGWHPGRALERQGFVPLDRRGRLGVWQRTHEEAPQRASVLLCSWRSVSIGTQASLLNLAGVDGSMMGEDNEIRMARVATSAWRIKLKSQDGLIPRSRSIVASRWWQETADDVFLMVDDDITFSPQEAERLVAWCRAGLDIVCGAYPVGDASHLAIRAFQGSEIMYGDPVGKPIEIEYAATGFMAVHRRVLDALIPTLPLCHADKRWAYWPMFHCMLAPMGKTLAELSEDWSFCKRARDAGFKVWVDPTIKLGHIKEIELGIMNMCEVHEAIQRGVR